MFSLDICATGMFHIAFRNAGPGLRAGEYKEKILQQENEFAAELAVAVKACNLAQEVIRSYFLKNFEVEEKADKSPVTIADIEAEKVIRTTLLDAFPDYGFYGEETGQQAMHSAYRWLVDPIDGTKSFVRGSPFFSTQIALQKDNSLVVGVSNAPCYGLNADLQGQGEQVTAVAGQAVQLNGVAVTTSGTTRLQDAFLSSGNLKTMSSDDALWQRYGQLVRQVARVRGYGDFCHYHQLVSAQADLVIESDVNILDIAALSLAVTEAGGVFTDLQGHPVGLETTSVLAAATPELHQQALELLN